MKWLGIILILIGSVATGMAKSANYRQNLSIMEELKKSFLEIQQAIHFRNLPLRESFRRITNPSCQSFFACLARELAQERTEEFASLWEKQVREEEMFRELGREERKLLMQVGKNLWQLHADGAEGEIAYFLAKWDARMEERKKEKKEKCKLYYVCSIGGGLLLTIMLI